MTIRVTIIEAGRNDQYGIPLNVGTIYTLEDNFGKDLIQQGFGIDTDNVLASPIQPTLLVSTEAALRAALLVGGEISLAPNITLSVAATAVLRSNTTLNLNGSTIKLAAGAGTNILVNYAHTQAKVPLTGAFTAVGKVGTVNHNAHGRAVGSFVEIGGTTSYAYNGVYRVEAATTNSFTVALPGTPFVTTATGSPWIRAADDKITVKNGWLDFDYTNQPYRGDIRAHASIFNGVHGLVLADMGAMRCQKYGFAIGAVSDYRFSNLRFSNLNSGADGLHLNGPAHRGESDGHYGTTGDDFVSLTIGDYANWEISRGDMIDLTCRDINSDYCEKNMFKVAGNTPFRFENIIIEKMRGRCLLNAVTLYDDLVGMSLIGTAAGAVKIRDVSVETSSQAINVSVGGKFDLLEVDGVDFDKCGSAALNLANGSTFGTVRVRNIYGKSGATAGARSVMGINSITADVIDVDMNVITDTGHGIVFTTGADTAVIGTLIAKLRIKNLTSGSGIYHDKGSVGTVILDVADIDGGTNTQLYRQTATTGGAPAVIFGSVKGNALARLAEFQVPSKVQLGAVVLTNQTNTPIRGFGTGTAIRIEGSMQVSGSASRDYEVATGSPLVSLKGNLRADGTAVGNPVLGDEFFNTNASWASGTGTDKRGKYGYNGSAWTKLYGPA